MRQDDHKMVFGLKNVTRDQQSISILISGAGETVVLTKPYLYHVFVLQIFHENERPPRYITSRKYKSKTQVMDLIEKQLHHHMKNFLLTF